MADSSTTLEAVNIPGSRSGTFSFPRKISPGTTEIKGVAVAEQYLLTDIILFGTNYSVSLKELFIEISVYEDIFRSSISGYVLLNDAISLISTRGIHGSEYLVLTFSKSKDSTDTFKRSFRVYKIDNRTRGSNQGEAYSIHFCSEELIFSEQRKISKSYSNTISNIVEQIVYEELKVPKGRFSSHDTVGQYDMIIPYKTPLEAVNWLTNYAIGAEKKNACDYVFFENRFGYHFKSMQTMMDFGKERPFFYMYQPRSIADPVASSSFSMINVYNYEILDSFDSLHGVKSGMMANSLLSVDPMTRRYYFTGYSYLKHLENHTAGGPNIPFTVFPNRGGEIQTNEVGSRFKYTITNADHKLTPGIKDTPDAVMQDFRVEQTIPHRTSQMPASHYHRIRITVPGNPNVTVGDTLFFSLLSEAIANEKQADGYYSGIYLVSSVRHLIDPTANYRTLIELIKENTPSPYMGHDSTNATLKNLVKSIIPS